MRGFLYFVTLCLGAAALPSLHGNNRSDGSCQTSFMTQWVDHSNRQGGKFQQQVQVITDHFKPGGPILLFQGEETSVMTCVETTSMCDYAQKLGGIAATIEHRYFGSSTPFSPNRSYTPEGFKFLTLDNVMDDAVEFINQIRQNVTGAENSPTIIASGSYGGFLATAFRLNRPDTIFGAIAAAPPINGFLTANGSVPDRFNWWNYISNVISDKSASAAFKIREAFEAVENTLAAGNASFVQEALGLCQTPTSSEDHALLFNLLIIPFGLVSEFNYPFTSPGRTPIANPLDVMVETVLESSNSMQLLKSTTLLWFKSLDPSLTCLDIETSAVQAVPLIQSVPFTYITCTYAPIVNTGVSNYTVFEPVDPTPAQSFSFCNSTYGVTPMTAEELGERYHLSHQHYKTSERIIFSVGQYDPTTSLAPQQLPNTSNRNASRILYVSNMAHREELFSPNPRDKPEVIAARAIEVEAIKEWLNRPK